MKIPKQFRILLPLVLIAGVISYVAYRTRRVPTPRRRWKRFDNPGNNPLNATICQAIQGIYSIEEGSHFFGKTAVLKYSYTVEQETTLYHLSFFCEKDGTYMLCEGKSEEGNILLNGHWRKAAANGTGIVRLIIENGINNLHAGLTGEPLSIKGVFGKNDKEPKEKLSLRFEQALPKVPSFDIIAHRGGSRNVDFLAVSENSIELIKTAAQLGATGIEIDVRMTRDGVPVVFHDSFFSIHTIKNKIYGGLLHNHTLKEIRRLELRKGGQIPTLEEMLSTVLYQTPLETVWLDIKKECDLELVRKIQEEYHQKAAIIDRKLSIYIGIPDNYLLRCFQQMENYQAIPSLIELDCDIAININAQVWAPQYTGGFQSDEVAKIHAAGKKAYVWSLDNRFMIDTYMSEGGFDGVVTNAAPVVAHWFYTEGYKMMQKKQNAMSSE